MRKRYFPPRSESIFVAAFVMAASGENRSAKVTTDFDEEDYDSESGSWNIWGKTPSTNSAKSSTTSS